jgi:hypothetical protein
MRECLTQKKSYTFVIAAHLTANGHFAQLLVFVK